MNFLVRTESRLGLHVGTSNIFQIQLQKFVKFEVFPFVKDNLSVLQVSDGEKRR